jgi:RNA polymerase sigma-70 factor (ECF subfamily)
MAQASAVSLARDASAKPDQSEQSRASAAEASRELVRRAQAGDRAAFEELIRSHQQRVFAVVGSILRKREDVEDVAQQVFIKVYVSLHRFDRRSSFSTWLYKVAVNECYDYLRKKRVRKLTYEADLSEEQVRQFESLEAGAAGSHSSAPPEIGRRTELRDLVERLLSLLSEEDRAMLVLKEVEGLSVEEISEVFGLNVNTVKVRLFRARGRMMEMYRKRLEERRS